MTTYTAACMSRARFRPMRMTYPLMTCSWHMKLRLLLLLGSYAGCATQRCLHRTACICNMAYHCWATSLLEGEAIPQTPTDARWPPDHAQ